MTMWLAALSITLAIIDPKSHKPVTVGFPPLKVLADVHTTIPHARKGEICVDSARMGRSCKTIEDVDHPTLQRPYTIRESDAFVASIRWEDDQGHWHYEESILQPVEIADDSR